MHSLFYLKTDMFLKFFGSIPVYSTIQYSIAVISLPVQLFGVYCIIAKTPPTMCSTKLHLLNFLMWSMAYDMIMTCVGQPYLFSTTMAGIPLGFLHMIGIGTGAQIYFGMTIAACRLKFSFNYLVTENRKTSIKNHKKPDSSNYFQFVQYPQFSYSRTASSCSSQRKLGGGMSDTRSKCSTSPLEWHFIFQLIMLCLTNIFQGNNYLWYILSLFNLIRLKILYSLWLSIFRGSQCTLKEFLR